ncbi:MAG: glucosaminidase domain-containing protein [Cellvibrionaceae bacterium]|nr:glucosaminidase domain-containing protein [Cellvibrionaceae bacterium]
MLAQAASESAWGTSRFAREGYNYFGQWCFKAGCGIVPKRRLEGAYHEVTRFDSVRESVAAYFHNINTHSAYHGLRLLRQEKTARREPFSGHELAGKLTSYSERGAPYIEELRSIMRSNQLESDLLAQRAEAENMVLSLDTENTEGEESPKVEN